jgi:hypothetical protein
MGSALPGERVMIAPKVLHQNITTGMKRSQFTSKENKTNGRRADGGPHGTYFIAGVIMRFPPSLKKAHDFKPVF